MAKYSQHGLFRNMARDPYFWAPAVAVGAGALASLGAEGVGKIIEAKNKAKHYKQMLDIHPQLQGRDPVLVGRIYNSLHNANPAMARDPMVSGAWVDTIVESGGLDASQASRALLEAVKDLSGIRAQMATARQKERAMTPQIGSGVERAMLRGIDRAKEVQQEYGDIAALRQQVRDIQERHNEEKILDYAKRVEKGLGRAAAQHGMDPQALLSAVSSGAFKSAGKLTAAVRK